MEAREHDPTASTASSSPISSDDTDMTGWLPSASEGRSSGGRLQSFGEQPSKSQPSAATHHTVQSLSKGHVPVPISSSDPGTPTMNFTTTTLDEATLKQIIRFWNHPSLQNVSADQKQTYLRRKGVTQEQLFQAWDRMVEDTTSNPAAIGGPPPTPSPSQHPPPTPFHIPADSNDPSSSNYNYYHPNDPSEDQGDVWSSAAMIAAMGGMLGLLAAATVRWLNGGDFLLFPPPTRRCSNNARMQSTTLTLQQQQSAGDGRPPTVEEENIEEEDDSDVEELDGDVEEEEGNSNSVPRRLDDEDHEIAQYLSSLTGNHNDDRLPLKGGPDALMMAQIMAQFAALGDTMKQQTSMQQRLLQKLSATTPNVTDQSMDILRRQQEESTSPTRSGIEKYATERPYVCYKLGAIQSELEILKQDMAAVRHSSTQDNTIESFQNSAKLETKLTETLHQLQGLLRDLEQHQGENGEHIDKPSTSEIEPEDDASAGTDVDLTKEASGLDESKEPSRADTAIVPSKHVESLPQGGIDTPTVETGTCNQHLTCLRQALTQLVQDNDDRMAVRTGAQILFLYMNNLSNHPHLPRYRKIHKTNESFQKVKILKGTDSFLEAVGFVDKVNVWEWEPNLRTDDGNDIVATDKAKYVDQLFVKQAVQCLAVLKSIDPNANVSPSSLLDLVLAKLPLPIQPKILATPGRSYASVAGSSSLVAAAVAESNQRDVLSPPRTTKKELSMPPSTDQDDDTLFQNVDDSGRQKNTVATEGRTASDQQLPFNTKSSRHGSSPTSCIGENSPTDTMLK